MNIIANKITLDVNKSGSQANIVAKYGESGARSALLSFTKKGQVYDIEQGNTVIIRAKKPDGTIIYNAAENQNGKAFFVFTEQFCSAVGKVLCEVQIIDGQGNTLYTPKFYLVVEGIVYTDGTITSSNEYSQLTQSILEAQNALELAQSLKLIEVVEELPETEDADDKVLYVIGQEEWILGTGGLPSEFQTEAAFNLWAADNTSKAVMLITTDGNYPYILFEGIEISYNNADAPGEYRITNKTLSQPIEYAYNINTGIWESYAPLIGVSVGDLLLTGTSYEGSDTPWETNFIPNDDAVDINAINGALLWVFGDYLKINSQAIGDITYSEANNKFNIYDGIKALSGYGNAYIYDSNKETFIEIANAAEVRETFADLNDALIESFNTVNGHIAEVENDVEALETEVHNDYQKKLTAGDNVSIENNVISATDTTYTKGSGIDIANNEISVDTSVIQSKLTANKNIKIDANNKISGKYTNITTGPGIISSYATHTEGGFEYQRDYNIAAEVAILVFTNNNNTWTCNKTFNEIGLDINQNKRKYLIFISTGTYSYIYGVGHLYVFANNAIVFRTELLTGGYGTTQHLIIINSNNTIEVQTTNISYQKKLIAGDNITIDNDGTISASGGGSSYAAGNGIEINNDVISLPTVDSSDVGKVMTVVETEIDTGEVDEDDEPIYDVEYNWVVGKARADINITINTSGTSVVSSSIEGITASANDILDYLADNRATKTIFANVGFQGPNKQMVVPIIFAGSSAYITGILNDGYLLSIGLYRSNTFVIEKYFELVNYNSGDSEEY